MKFKVDNRECEYYQLSNRDMVDLLKGGDLTDEERAFLTEKVIKRFEYNDCPRCGEDNKHVFVRQFSDFVNGKCHGSKREIAKLMGYEHRYLQQEMFKVCLEYIKLLAENTENNRYDARNEWACYASKHMIDGLKAANYPY